MSVNCTQCSTVLPARAAFCWRCGYVRRTATGGNGSIAYEACEIVYGRSSRPGRLVFWAKATGESGTYAVAESEPLKRDETGTYLADNHSQSALDSLVGALVAQGWESLGTLGSHYWEHRLRRPVTPQTAAASG
jgi:hypothetical protein